MKDGPVAIIGLGCIGGSLARALVQRGVPVRAWSESARDRELAAGAGIVVSGDVRAALQGATVVVIAVPLPHIAAVAVDAVVMAPNAAVLHTGSLQRATAVKPDITSSLHARVIGTHPIAGSHESGFSASRADLFAGCTVSIEARAKPYVRAAAEELWHGVGAARLDYREAEEHDRLMVWVSHLPQLTATALAGALDAHGVPPRDAGPGARDTTRLAASPLEIWAPLLDSAPGDLDAALAALETRVAELRRAVSARDAASIAALWEPARAWRRASEDRS
jgi:prephenate dehydrogenase